MSAEAVTRVNICLHSEQQLVARNTKPKPLPVTIVSGFLGSGKTSLLRHILSNRRNLNIAFAVSDFAVINVDELLVTQNHVFSNESDSKVYAFPAGTKAAPALKDIVFSALYPDVHYNCRNCDYLIVETSGTADPTALIVAVQEKFGKMTHARLDTVVVVVDAEALTHSMDSNYEILIKQLQCADAILLNKVDLIQDSTQVRNVVLEHAPHARVYETKFCNVYLPHILDIHPSERASDTVSHEQVTLRWNIGSVDSFGEIQNQKATMGNQIQTAEKFQSISYEQVEPIHLSSLRDWIQSCLPPGTLRIKCIVYIAEDPVHRYVLQLSGKQRVHLENCGRWVSTPKSQLIVIAARDAVPWDEVTHLQQMKSTLTKIPNVTLHDREICFTYFENDGPLHKYQMSDNVVQFRLQCPKHLRPDLLRHQHQIDLNQVNIDFVHDLNANGCLFLYQTVQSLDEEHRVVIMAPINSKRSDWSIIDDRASHVLVDLIRRLSTCQCNF
ncbi:hypothetical protein ABG067_005518 [Albugo candida]